MFKNIFIVRYISKIIYNALFFLHIKPTPIKWTEHHIKLANTIKPTLAREFGMLQFMPLDKRTLCICSNTPLVKIADALKKEKITCQKAFYQNPNGTVVLPVKDNGDKIRSLTMFSEDMKLFFKISKRSCIF